MNAILIARYPGNQLANVIKVFTAPDVPPRHDSLEEVGGVTYMVGKGYRTVILFSLPEADVAAALEAQTKRTAYMTHRVEGLSLEMHFGYAPAEGIPMVMGVLG